MKFELYFHTLRYLKFRQVAHRLLKKLKHPKKRQVSWRAAEPTGTWADCKLNKQSVFADKVNFLNHEVSVNAGIDWNKTTEEKLWLYNLHYFDDLCAGPVTDERTALQEEFIKKWVADNPFGFGNGWEAYPASLRIVNWIKAFKSHITPTETVLESLALQADYLYQDQELHLLGNHYFVNLKALIFAGVYFDGALPELWLKGALKEYEKELQEQVLADGANFELTPMYHCIMLVDLIDLLNLFNAYPNKVDQKYVSLTRKKVESMFFWLENMCHPDDGISFFNDATFGIAPTKEKITAYAQQVIPDLSFTHAQREALYSVYMEESGYIRAGSPDWVLIADVGNVGPDYIPGHGHADTFSYEFSLGGKRVFVNSGISQYGIGNERLRQRGTAAHNTVEVSSKNSSNVWSGFRVAQRARVLQPYCKTTDSKVCFGAQHNGYKKQGVNVIHSRNWEASLSAFVVEDELKGASHTAISFLHLHPEVNVSELSTDTVKVLSGGYEIQIACSGANVTIDDSEWFPGFGLKQNNKVIKMEFEKSKLQTEVRWRKV